MGRMTIARVMSIVACTALLLVTGASPASQGPGARSGGEGPGVKKSGCSAVSDETIRDTVIAALREHMPPISGVETTFGVSVKKGVVKVKGTVENSGDRRAIIGEVTHVPCVKDVKVGGLKVACTAAAPVGKHIGESLSMLPCAVKNAITATYSNGVVTLTGTVPSETYKRQAKRMVEVIDCVKKVKNKLVVVVPPAVSVDCATIPDATLQELVVEAIGAKVSCGAKEPITVGVSNRVITLTGTTTREAKQLAVAAASKYGCQVIDRLGIQEPGCPAGSITCTTLDGEQWCCYACRVCPAQ